jgi:hypothetical protein
MSKLKQNRVSPLKTKVPPTEAVWGDGKRKVRRGAIFPEGLPSSIVAASSLYDRVRDGNGWDPVAKPPN